MDKMELYPDDLTNDPVGVAEVDSSGLWRILFDDAELAATTSSEVVKEFLEYAQYMGGTFVIKVE